MKKRNVLAIFINNEELEILIEALENRMEVASQSNENMWWFEKKDKKGISYNVIAQNLFSSLKK